MPRASHGVLDLSGWDFKQDGIVNLDGEWSFYWHKLLNPRDFSTKDRPTSTYFDLPKPWTGQKVNGQELGSDGFVTFRLIVKLRPQVDTLGFKLDIMGTAYRFWANGKIVAQSGVVGKNREQMVPRFQPQVGLRAIHTDHLDLVLQISNFYDKHGGLWNSIRLGMASQMIKERDYRVALDLFLCGVTLIMSLYHFGLFFMRRTDYSTLIFGTFCGLISLRMLLTNERMLTSWTDISWVLAIKLEFLTFYLGVIATAMFVHVIFPDEFKKIVLRIFGALLGIFSLVVAVAPPKTFITLTMTPAQLTTLVLIFYVIWVLILSLRRKRETASIATIGFLTFFITVIVDIITANHVIDFPYIAPYGFLVLIFSQSLILAIKFSKAFKTVEVLSNNLEQKVIQLKRLDQLKDEFLANTSHELRTPLNGIIGMSEALIQGGRGPLSEKVQRDLSLIALSGRRLTGLVNDILDLSKLKHRDLVLDPKPIALDSMVQLMLELYKPTIGKKELTLQNEVPADLPAVMADENRLHQILQNLLGNAIKFSERGMITVGAKLYEEDVRVFVSDTGIGIPAEHQQRIFEQFEQADGASARSYGGTGLGLSITKQLVELHGGKIWCDSTPGRGSTFYFTLKTTGLKPEAEPANSGSLLHSSFQMHDFDSSESLLSPESTSKNDGPCVLVVDDEMINLEVVSSHLSLHGFRVIQAASGPEALEAVEREEKIDLILLDVMMPHMTGLEVCRIIRQRESESELPVILLTAKNQIADLIAGFTSGANDYLVKPFSSQELLARIQNHIKVKDLTKEIISRKESQARMEKDLDAARAVQETLFLPSSDVSEIESTIYYQSADKTGGDWYGTFYDKNRKRMIVMIGDVTGHGFSSALVTGVTCGAVRSRFYTLQAESPQNTEEMLFETVKVLNQVVRETGFRERKSITMSFLVFDFLTGEVTYLNAGHNPIYYLSKGNMEPLLVPSYAIGEKEMPHLETKKLTVSPGDIFFLYTDGLIENAGPDGAVFKRRALEKVLKKASPLEPQALRTTILDRCSAIWQNQPPQDDCTFMVIKYLGIGSHQNVSNEN